jgi:sulfite reductase beta subunit-like hemoprotein
MKVTDKISVTVLLPAGRLPLDIMEEAQRLAREYKLRIYLSTLQNLRLTDIKESDLEPIKAKLTEVGAEFKGPGKFPLPRVCVGKGHCNLGVIDTEEFSDTVLAHFHDRDFTKAKFKIAVAGCTMCCSSVKTTDIGIMATRKGFDVYAGGKGGPSPQIGRRIARSLTEVETINLIQNLVDYHDRKTEKKQRIYKLLSEQDFPFPEV